MVLRGTSPLVVLVPYGGCAVWMVGWILVQYEYGTITPTCNEYRYLYSYLLSSAMPFLAIPGNVLSVGKQATRLPPCHLPAFHHPSMCGTWTVLTQL